MPEVTWFASPSAGRPGTLNAAYQLLDARVVEGDADAVALSGSGRSTAWLLETSAALAGALAAFALGPGDPVRVDVVDDESAAVALLAVARIGAVVSDAGRATVSDAGIHVPGNEPLPRDLALRAGRTDPAPAAAVPPEATAAAELTVLELAERLAALSAPAAGEIRAAFGPSLGS